MEGVSSYFKRATNALFLNIGDIFCEKPWAFPLGDIFFSAYMLYINNTYLKWNGISHLIFLNPSIM